jgi:phosphotriesterase-related protein
VHTGDGAAADEQLEILKTQGVHPSARIWIHAQSEPDTRFHITSAQRGSWVSFDGVNAESVSRHVELIMIMKAAGLLDKVLVSHDSGWYHVGEAGGGTFNHYNTIFTQLVPALKSKGITSREIELIFVKNPSNAFAVKVRKA